MIMSKTEINQTMPDGFRKNINRLHQLGIYSEWLMEYRAQHNGEYPTKELIADWTINEMSRCFNEFIDISLTWSHTINGHDYWENISYHNFD